MRKIGGDVEGNWKKGQEGLTRRGDEEVKRRRREED